MLKITRNQRGDTIVEVLVVLAVLGMALGTSYAIAGRSLINARQAQENAKATELLKEQLETIRVLAAQGSILPTHSNFCIGVDGVRKTGANTNPECLFENSLYRVTVTQSSDQKFTLKAVWDDVGGDGKASATLVYRRY